MDEESTTTAERLYLDRPNILRDNILSYVAGYIERYLLGKLECKNFRSVVL